MKIGKLTRSEWMLNCMSLIAVKLLSESLIAHSLNVIIQLKYATKVSRKGFDFLGAFSKEYNRYVKMIVTQLTKDIPFINKAEVYVRAYISLVNSSGSFELNIIHDEAVKRYIWRVQRVLANKGIPIFVSEPRNITIYSCNILVRAESNMRQRDMLRMYKLVYHSKVMLDILKTLHRKALFTDGTSRNHNIPRFIRDGYF